MREIKLNFLNRNNPYYVLGVKDVVSFEEVKAAYRKMVLKFHPDKRKDKVSDEEANFKFREIQRAFEIIKEQKRKG